jgi:inhibitor of cysteine peptidase
MRIPHSFKLFLLFALVVFVVQSKTLLLNDTDNNSHICLYEGDTITIKLISNPTTGYSWAKPEAMTQLRLVSSRVERGGSERAGVPGYQIFSFKAIGAGDCTVTLNYLRPFEKNTPPAKVFHASVSVEVRPTNTEDRAKP